MKNIIDKIKDFMIGPEYDEDEEEFIYEDEELDEDEAVPRLVKDAYSTKSPRKERDKSSVSVSASDKIVSIHSNNIQMQVVIVYPKVVDDTSAICEYLKENKILVVNLENVDREETQRIVDFLSGVAYALDGDFQSISNRIFIAAPHCVDISGKFKEELKSSGVIFPWVSSAMK